MKRLLVTGSSGLIGSETCLYFAENGWEIHGLDNNQRATFFGPDGDTRWNQRRISAALNDQFVHHELDIRNRPEVLKLVKAVCPSAIVHTAAQPSHDRAAAIPFDDFETNAVGSLNLLEAARQSCPESPFVHMSTNKVYGDRPNSIDLVEKESRWEYADPAFVNGIPETFSIDQSKHSLFGASKVAADIMVQEYGRYFGMPTCALRAGCLTGPNHSGVELHGFLSFLVKCNVERREFCIYGYKGKQVRDNLHSLDVTRFIDAFIENPRSGEVYNLGGGKANTCSIMEAMQIAEKHSGVPMHYRYEAEHRVGDHICYYSDLSKTRAHYPRWTVTVGLEETIEQLVSRWKACAPH
jgi:CDP-paratose 2-epimerase